MGALRVIVCGAIVAGMALLAPVEADAAGATVSAKLSKTSIQLGETVLITGTVSPVRATPAVMVQRSLGGGRWSDRVPGAVAADGTFRVTIKPSGAGLYALRVRSSGGSVVSNNLFLKVRYGRAQVIRNVDWVRYPHSLATLCTDAFLSVSARPPTFGDLNGDGVEEAVVPVTCQSGGTLYVPKLAIYEWRSGAARYVGRWEPSGLPTEWAATIDRVIITSRVVTASGKYVPMGGCHACLTAPWSRRLVLRGTRLVPA